MATESFPVVIGTAAIATVITPDGKIATGVLMMRVVWKSCLEATAQQYLMNLLLALPRTRMSSDLLVRFVRELCELKEAHHHLSMFRALDLMATELLHHLHHHREQDTDTELHTRCLTTHRVLLRMVRTTNSRHTTVRTFNIHPMVQGMLRMSM
jgi:hypothetical protein